MNVSSFLTSAERPSIVNVGNARQAREDLGAIAKAQQEGDSVGLQQAVAELRKDAPAIQPAVPAAGSDNDQDSDQDLAGSTNVVYGAGDFDRRSAAGSENVGRFLNVTA